MKRYSVKLRSSAEVITGWYSALTANLAHFVLNKRHSCACVSLVKLTKWYEHINE